VATADSTLVIDAETGKAIRELVKLTQAQEKVEKGNKNLGKEFAETSRQSDKMSQSAGAVTGKLKGMVAGFASLATATQIVAALNAELKQTVDLSDKAAKGTAAFATQIANDPNAANILKGTRLQGAGYGLTPQETGEIANVIKAAGGSLDKDFATAARLNQLGVQSQDAAAIVQMGITRGMGSDKAASLALTATDLSPTDMATIAKVAPKTRGFQTAEAGLAGAATLSTAGITPEQLPAATEALGRVLNKEQSALTKKFGLQGMSEAERLATLSRAADASGDRAAFIRQLPEKYKLGEEEGRALQAVLGQGDKYFESERALRATGAGDLEARHQRLRDVDPMFAQSEDARIAAETSKMADIYGPTAGVAQANRASRLERGARMQREHPYLSKIPGMVDEESGEIGWLGQGMYNQFGWMGPGADKQQGRTNDEVRQLREALDRNTEATRENSQSTGGSAPARNANL